MNTLWLVADLAGHEPHRGLLGAVAASGAAFIAAAAWHSQDLRRLRLFRR